VFVCSLNNLKEVLIPSWSMQLSCCVINTAILNHNGDSTHRRGNKKLYIDIHVIHIYVKNLSKSFWIMSKFSFGNISELCWLIEWMYNLYV
jgi:hypothetical protein